MEAIKKISGLIIGASMLFCNNVFSQTTYNSAPVLIPFPPHDVLYGQTKIMAIMGGSYGGGSAPLSYLGINTETPVHMLDINGGDANIGGINQGYMIGGNYVLWIDGPNFNLMVGIGAGNATLSGGSNTMLGYDAGNALTSGMDNTFLGTSAGQFTTGGTFPAGSFNTMAGIECGLNNTTGHTNSYYGKLAAEDNNGSYNCMYGGHSGSGNSRIHAVDSNSFYGTYSNYYGTAGNDNVYIGMNAALTSGDAVLGYAASNYNVYIGGLVTQKNPSGNYNIVLGYEADAYTGTASSPGTILNSVAIGAASLVNYNNQFILGNNSQFVGIGMVGAANGPQANLEIRTDANPIPPTVGINGFIGSGAYNAANYYGGEGFSGLKFTDLNSMSSTVDPGNSHWNIGNPYPSGVLSVDGYGNVIYIPNAGVGYCSALTPLTANAGYNLNNTSNFYFQGNNSGSLTYNNVSIGNPCTYSPKAKLDVYQNSGTTSSIGLFVDNADNGASCGIPAIGVYSEVPNNITFPVNVPDVAGFFNAPGRASSNCNACAAFGNFALFVPSDSATNTYGGYVAIGAPYPYDYTCTHGRSFIGSYFGALVTVNGSVTATGFPMFSDSTLKKDITPLPSNVLQKVRSLRPVTYQWKEVTDTLNAGTHYGFIAQQVDTVFPLAIRRISQNGLYTMSYTDMVPILTKAVQQLDSTTTSNHKNDSTIQAKQQQTIDSLRTVLASIQNCLSTLCAGTGDGHAPHNSSQDTTVQSITLSNANAPLLYQNIPNPFTVGTKINYYLPQGTLGASIVFYDAYGNQIKMVQLNQTGNGTLNITPDNLTNGIYSYSLVVNGNVIDTKRMVLQK